MLFIFSIWYQVYGDTRKDAQAWPDPFCRATGSGVCARHSWELVDLLAS
ncbi:MAG: hypothetical protein ACREUL_20350 [Steroidobacteraceae bacterium]